MPLAPGTRLGSYRIVGPLGAGGMGEVYLAHDQRLGRDVAVKVLPESLAGDPERLARLEREARTVAGLNHPNIVVLHSVEDADGVRFLTMELVEGQSLTGEIVAGGLPVARVLELAIPIADALVAAHQRGVVHCDLKPANVMVTPEGRVKVLDFGLATTTAAASATAPALDVTRPRYEPSSEGMGTAPYMAPEQIRGEPTDARTDLFAFGVLLFELLTGRRPFQGATSADVTSAILRDTPPSVGALRAGVPADLGRLVGRCLEKDPDRRVQTAKDVRNELELVARAVAAGGGGAGAAPSASIAVLPFANRGRDEDDEYFADGITEDVIAQLAKMRTLKVISRTSVMPFKKSDQSVQQIAAHLQVATVLEGSVRRIGDRVRIVAQLVEAASGRSLWAETYDRQLNDIFAIQSDVALRIADGLKAELSPIERRRITREPTQDMQAYEHYLRGRHAMVRFTPVELQRAIDHFARAIARDPNFALPHVGTALAYAELAELAAGGQDEIGPVALAAGERAVALDPELGEAYCARGHARRTFQFDWEGAEADFRRALELSPNSADTYDLYGRLCSGLQRWDEAIALLQRAYELDPLTHRADLASTFLRAGRNEEAVEAATAAIALDPSYPRVHATLGWGLLRSGRTSEGIAALEHAVTLDPDGSMWLAQLGQAYGMAGRRDEARDVLRRLQDPARSQPAPSYHLTYVHLGLGDLEAAMDCLERAFEEGAGAVTGIKGSFLLAPLREHPRFIALLERIGLGQT
jgi:serine/threonine protein kinase/tetratricopeptide (TPR) repeat protein